MPSASFANYGQAGKSFRVGTTFEVALSLAGRMIEAGRPVFGICPRLQEINVLFGGTLTDGLVRAPITARSARYRLLRFVRSPT